MGFEVLVENLQDAARKLRSTTAPLAGYDFEETNVTPESFGHVELAAWFLAVTDQCDQAGKALHTGAEVMADSLDSTADDYSRTDQSVSETFANPFGPAWGPR